MQLRRKVRTLAIARATYADISAKLGLSTHFVKNVIRDLEAHSEDFNSRRRGERPVAPRTKIVLHGRPPNPLGLRADDPLYRRFYGYFMRGNVPVQLARQHGISEAKIRATFEHWLSVRKTPMPPCSCGRPAFHTGGCLTKSWRGFSKRRLRRIEHLIMQGKTVREVAEELALTPGTVAVHAIDARAKLFAMGKTCACGRPIGHPYWCSAQWDSFGKPRGRRPFPEPFETQARKSLLRGDRAEDIAEAIGTSASSVNRLRRSMTDAELSERAANLRARASLRDENTAERTLAMVRAAVPHDLILTHDNMGNPISDSSLRDDVISEIYVAIMEGRIEEGQLRAVVRSFISRGRAEWQGAQQSRRAQSLDAAASADGGRTLAELIGDTTASLSIDDIEIGERQ